MKFQFLFAFVIISILDLSYSQLQNASDICVTEECVETAALLATSIDARINPCDNFYSYACGNWEKDHPLPVDRDEWSHWAYLNNLMIEKLNDVLVRLTHTTTPKYLQPLIRWYQSCTNLTARQSHASRDFTRIKSIVNRFGGWPMVNDSWRDTAFNLEDALIALNKIHLARHIIIDIEVIQDLKNNSKFYIGLGNPFESENVKFRGIHPSPKPKEKYNFFDIGEYYEGEKSPTQQVTEAIKGSVINQAAWDAEAKNMKSLDQALRNHSTSFNESYYYQNWDKLKMQFKDLDRFTGINWKKIINGITGQENITILDTDIVIIDDVQYIQNLTRILGNYTKKTIANYIATTMGMIMAKFTTGYLDHEVTQLPSPADVPEQCIWWATEIIPDLMSRIFIDNIFEKQAIADMKSFISSLKTAYLQILEENTWMDNSTKAIALQKLSAVTDYIAYPEYITNDAQLEAHYADFQTFNADNLLENSITYFHTLRSSDLKLLKATQWPEKGHWPGDAVAVEVNAFYYPELNGIFFPAGIAQFPFYQHDRTMTANLGGIGTVIGHEITHGFDNFGSLFDLRGNLNDWFTSTSRQNFNQRAQCFVNQYNKFAYDIGEDKPIHINGQQTLPENIADNGGIRVAFRAMQNYKKDNPSKLLKLPGKMSNMTEEQLFFLSYANLWCVTKSAEGIADQIKRDPHSIESARVLGPLVNFEEFSKAFNCPAKSPMNPDTVNRCHLW